MLPGDGYYDIDFDEFLDVAKRSARPGTSQAVQQRGFARLLAAAELPWNQQRPRRSHGLGSAGRRAALRRPASGVVLELASTGEWSWVELGGASLLRIPVDGGEVNLRLTDAELASLAELCPELASK